MLDLDLMLDPDLAPMAARRHTAGRGLMVDQDHMAVRPITKHIRTARAWPCYRPARFFLFQTGTEVEPARWLSAIQLV